MVIWLTCDRQTSLLFAGKKLCHYYRMRTNVHTLVFHLTIADSIVSFVTMPLEAGWRYSMQWTAGDISCRLLMVVRALGYYLSSAMLVMLCIDRSLDILQIFIIFPFPLIQDTDFVKLQCVLCCVRSKETIIKL